MQTFNAGYPLPLPRQRGIYRYMVRPDTIKMLDRLSNPERSSNINLPTIIIVSPVSLMLPLPSQSLYHLEVSRRAGLAPDRIVYKLTALVNSLSPSSLFSVHACSVFVHIVKQLIT